jgi:hypothetical protein
VHILFDRWQNSAAKGSWHLRASFWAELAPVLSIFTSTLLLSGEVSRPVVEKSPAIFQVSLGGWLLAKIVQSTQG